ncbi:MAG: argininosuccinate synthase [Acidobacteria bacterium RIFCSPLOWO2_02_FULL_61_28]|nr:MAG: argininosuccinate synthase [Acidobacteria bacterium RIFCSPLOWO2_02_FULL_61_28]
MRLTNSKPAKVVLAYSGGLDTSIIIPWLKENYGCEVIAMVGDIGQGDDMKAVAEKAKATGASKVLVEDLREEFVTEFLWRLVRSGAVYEHKYLLGTSIARPLLARAQVEVALREGADGLSHGCTGKGNDQVRFELTYKAFAPHLTVIVPWREWTIRSREDAVAYAREHNVPIAASLTKIYSRDQNIWHLSHEGGALEDPAGAVPDDVWQLTRSPKEAPESGAEVQIGFERGVPVSVNGKRLGPVEIVETLNKIGGEHAIGRTDLVENRFVGMKSRGAYETPGGTLIVLAHRELEALCLDRETSHYKQHVAVDYARLVYNGYWFTPLREALDAFIEQTQRTVTGEVRLRLYRGNVEVAGRSSPYSLYSEDIASFTMGASYNQKDAEGFINIIGLPVLVRAAVESRMPAPGKK